MKNHLSMSLISILAGSVPGIANGQFTVTAQIGGIPSVNGAILENFNEPNPPILMLAGSAYLRIGSDGVATPPAFSGGTAAFFGETPANGPDASQFVAVEPGGSATLGFSTPQHYLGLHWGTIDPYAGMNDLTFYDSAFNLIGTLGGQNIMWSNGSLNPGDSAYVNIISTTAFSWVVASATPIYPESFEFDDVAYAAVVPEPASGALFGAGLCIIGLHLVRRQPGSVQA
ncbi:MAG TPA: PEP-CTERM sorting domain-containing protein [Candidatus Acidoferrum sp.]|nr:PEP-CTERM sorting domain-containing protein [Candidatus Acidoferrum sp.]